MSDFSKIAKQMREDWDRRISHDYRFWMTESHTSDQAMWESGKRDSTILLEGITERESKTLLEIGCGIGRILKASLPYFAKIIGCDVSQAAISKARQFLGDDSRVQLLLGDGYTLQPLLSSSIDIVASFAAITSMPVPIAANYLREMHRVLKPNGIVRLQMYLGQEQIVCSNDTLHLRCYKRDNFINAAQAAGFEVEYVKELVLPFQVSFKEIGIEAFIVSLKRKEASPLESSLISSMLLPDGEKPQSATQGGREIECWMSLNYARDLVERGEIDRAREALDYALSFSKSVTIDIRDIVDQIVNQIERTSEKKCISTASNVKQNENNILYAQNLKVLSEKFPLLADSINAQYPEKYRPVICETSQGKVIQIDGLCLDHHEKPLTSAATWANRLREEKRIKGHSSYTIVGFGAGYHLDELLKDSDLSISVVEPSLEVLRSAMLIRDLRTTFSKLQDIHCGSASQWSSKGNESELVIRPQSQALYSDYCAELKSVFYGYRGLATLQPSIAVVGPLQGGTLPISGYCLRGLFSMGQRTRLIDVSGFASGFHQLEKMVYDKARQSTIQGTYIEMMSQVILESISEKPIDILICMAQAPVSGRVLMELRKMGIITVLWFVEDYLRFTYWKDIAQYYDFIFTIQQDDCIKSIKSAGAGEVHYLPVGCDPIVHTPLRLTADEKKRWGSAVSFVGAGYHNRQQIFAQLCETDFKLWGTEWPTCKPFDRIVQEGGRRLAPEEYVKIFNATDININLHSSAERDGIDPYGDFVNPRTFELAAAGAFQLSDQRSLMPELFEYEKEIVTFKSSKEMRDKIDYYLSHPEERSKITSAAREKVLTHHTYQHRMRQMMKIIFAGKYEQLKGRLDKSPWKKMLERSKPHQELHERCHNSYNRGEEPALDGLISDIVTGKGKLSETEQKLLFLYHIRRQILRMKAEEGA